MKTLVVITTKTKFARTELINLFVKLNHSKFQYLILICWCTGHSTWQKLTTIVFFFGNEERRNMLLLMFSFSDCKSRLFSFYKAVYGYLFQHNSWWYILVFLFLLFLKIVLFSAAKSENITRPPNPLLYEILVFIIFQVYIVDKTCLEKWIPLKKENVFQTQILVQKTLSNLIFVLRVWPWFFFVKINNVTKEQ